MTAFAVAQLMKFMQKNIARYKKILQIANTIVEEIRFYQEDNLSISFKYPDKYKILEVERPYISDNAQVISKERALKHDYCTILTEFLSQKIIRPYTNKCWNLIQTVRNLI